MQATIHMVQPYDLHGIRYFALRYVADGEEQLREARLSYDMTYADPQPGDRVEIRAILGVVDRVTKLEPA